MEEILRPEETKSGEMQHGAEPLGRDWPNLIVFPLALRRSKAVQADRIFRIELDTKLSHVQWMKVKAALQGSNPKPWRAAQLIIDARTGDPPGVPQLIRLALDPDTVFPCAHPWENVSYDHDGEAAPEPAAPERTPPKGRIDIVEDFAEGASPRAMVRLILDVPFDPDDSKTVEEVEDLLANDPPALKQFVEEQAEPGVHEQGIIDAFFAP